MKDDIIKSILLGTLVIASLTFGTFKANADDFSLAQLNINSLVNVFKS